ncbi:hypothetical protein [Limnospira indica]|uniref:hypothetical protein n=1 Tax=Limnospira indica TaxID=147322 RepID=UPI00186205E7|nr:hypothetical protein [Limnospira indica]QNH57673.1 MAG: hypothetical protein H2674_27005 [Limnospira indica BM01]
MPPHPNLPQKPPFSTPQPIPRRHFLVGWVERSRNPTQSARLGVIKFLWGFLGSHNLLLVRSLYTTHSDSSRLAGAIALHNTLGL